jgi:hypothetical protein
MQVYQYERYDRTDNNEYRFTCQEQNLFSIHIQIIVSYYK